MDEERQKRLIKEMTLNEFEVRRPGIGDERPTPEQVAAARAEEILIGLGDAKVRVINHDDWGVMWASDVAKKIGTIRNRVLRAADRGSRIRGHYIAYPGRPFKRRRSGPKCPVFSTHDGKTPVNRYETIADAAEALSIGRSGIANALKNGHRCHGMLWRYSNVPLEQQPPEKTRHKCPVFCTLDGRTVIERYDSIAQATEVTGAGVNTIYLAVRKGSMSHGFFWRYADIPIEQQPPLKSYPTIRVFSTLDGKTPVQRYNSIKEAAAAAGVHRHPIECALYNGYPVAGFHWRRTDVPLDQQPPLREKKSHREPKPQPCLV